MGSDLLLDTDVCIDHLRGSQALSRATEDASYSLITRCELFSGHAADEDRVRRFLDALNEIGLDRDLAEQAGRLRRGLSMRTPDAIIAATAITHELTLVTRNRRDFERVRGLRLRDPADII
ncbi:MAG: type II toxin-antitoxin system VapC family toxin [Chloroflexota bacterium]